MSQPQTPKKPRTASAKPAVTSAAKKVTRPSAKQAQSSSADFVKRIEDVARESAATASRLAASGARNAVNAKRWLDQKWEEGADSLYAESRPIAIENLARLRSDFPALSPNGVRIKIADELREFVASGSEAPDSVLAAIRLYVLTAIEAQQDNFKSIKAKRRLVVQVILSTSGAVGFAAKYGRLLIEIVKIILAAVAKQNAAAVKGAGKAAARPVANKAKIVAKAVAPKLAEEAINQSGLLDIGIQLIVRYTQRTLGPAPVKWPAAPKTAPAKAPAKTAAKSAAKKPVAKPAARKPAAKPAAKRSAPKAK